MEPKKLTFAALVQNIFIPGVGDVSKTLSPDSAGSKVLSMTLTNGLVEIVLKHQSQAGRRVTTLAPMSSFTHVIVAE